MVKVVPRIKQEDCLMDLMVVKDSRKYTILFLILVGLAGLQLGLFNPDHVMVLKESYFT